MADVREARRRGGFRLRLACAAGGLGLLFAASCGRRGAEVVVYVAQDEPFARPILERFARESGIEVRPVFDTESQKSVGLANRLQAEAARPRADVFWNNEIINTLRLAEAGLLAPLPPAALAGRPAAFLDPAGRWAGLAARARVFLVNNNLVPAGEEPTSIAALAEERWRGQGGLAWPLYGTTATHAACLFALLGEEKAQAFFRAIKENGARLYSGNRACARAAGAGEIAFGLTDTDDALAELQGGSPVRLVFAAACPDRPGALFLPNTLALVQGGPNPAAGRRLAEFLLSPGVEDELASGPAGQIPLHEAARARPPAGILTPVQTPALEVDFAAAARSFAAASEFLAREFAAPGP